MSEDKLAKVHTFGEIQAMGEAMAKSGLFGFKKPEEAVALMLVAQAQGRHPASVAEEYDIIQGRPALKSKAVLARYQIAGGKIEWMERTPAKVSAKFYHPQGGELMVTWDMERAKSMGLAGKDNWTKQPMIMLQWRVVAEGIRATYPACLSGEYLAEEVMDMEPRAERDITPRPPLGDPQELPPPPADGVERITKEQARDLWLTVRETFSNKTTEGDKKAKKIFQDKQAAHGLASTNDLPAADFAEVMRWARGEEEPGDTWGKKEGTGG